MRATPLITLLLLLFSFLTLQAIDKDLDKLPSPFPNNNESYSDSIVIWMNDIINNYPTFSDDEYRQRLRDLSGSIDYRLDPVVKERIIVRTELYRQSTENILGLSDAYFPIFEEHLAKYDIPHHLKYLPIIESNLNPVAKSVASAVGLWQFIPSSGKLYGLDINTYIDERSDTYKASEAAAKMLRNLYNKYGDWALSMAAYNCGPGRVDRAIQMAGGVNDYWIVRKFLPTETQKYVPYFMAVVYVGEFQELHELTPRPIPQSFALTDTICIAGGISLFDLAKELDMSVDTLKWLNPSYRRNWVPQSNDGFTIVLPATVVAQLRGYQNALNRVLTIQKENPVRAVRRIRNDADIDWLCKAYRCTRQDILFWNQLPSNYRAQEGDLLAIRKYLVNKDLLGQSIPKRQIEGISIASLKVVGLDKESNKALTSTVYVNVDKIRSNPDHIANVASTSEPIKATARKTEPTVAIPTPEKTTAITTVPKAGVYSDNSTAVTRVETVPTTNNTTAQVGKPLIDEKAMEEALTDRSRNRRFRNYGFVSSQNDDENNTSTIESSYNEEIEAKPINNEVPVGSMGLVPNNSPIVKEEKPVLVSQQSTNLEEEKLLDRSRDRNLRGSSNNSSTEKPAAAKTEQTPTANINATPKVVEETVTEKKESPAQRRKIALQESLASTYTYYKVNKGESIWDVQAKFSNVSAREIMDENNISRETELRTGTILKIRLK